MRHLLLCCLLLMQATAFGQQCGQWVLTITEDSNTTGLQTFYAGDSDRWGKRKLSCIAARPFGWVHAYSRNREADIPNATIAGTYIAKLSLVNAPPSAVAWVTAWSKPRIVASGYAENRARYEGEATMNANFAVNTGANNFLRAKEEGSSTGYSMTLQTAFGAEVTWAGAVTPSAELGITISPPRAQTRRPKNREHSSPWKSDSKQTREEIMRLRGTLQLGANAHQSFNTTYAQAKLRFTGPNYNAGMIPGNGCFPPNAPDPIPNPLPDPGTGDITPPTGPGGVTPPLGPGGVTPGPQPGDPIGPLGPPNEEGVRGGTFPVPPGGGIGHGETGPVWLKPVKSSENQQTSGQGGQGENQ